jgi:carbonic anhydrase
MHSGFRILAATTAIVVLPGCDAAHEEIHWGYDGAGGPAHWAELSSDFAACATGQQQSPINLADATIMAGLQFEKVVGEVVLDFDTRSTVLDIVDNGHTIQVTPNADVGLNIAGDHFELAQFHFHSPSEHAIDGRRSPLEGHFVTSNGSGQLAVIGVLYEEGEHEPDFDPIIASLPQPGDSRHIENLELDLTATKPLPDEFFAYKGSLTTPPCSEGVYWFVAAEPEGLSAAQLEALTSLLHNNARPLQALNGRELMQVSVND